MKPIHLFLTIIAAAWVATGCASIGVVQLPSGYETTTYPVSAFVHGTNKTDIAADLSSFTTTYHPFTQLRRDTNTTHRWLLRIVTEQKQTRVQEYYILPAPARWGDHNRLRYGLISRDRTTCLTEWNVPKGTNYIRWGWGMLEDDPLGECRKVILVDGKLAAEVRFTVVAGPTQVSTNK